MTPLSSATDAAPAPSSPAPGSPIAGKYMTFKLGDEAYGTQILKVRELIALMDITRVPNTPSFVRGIINLRGKVIPVVDLRQKFGMKPTEATDQTVIVVVQVRAPAGELTMGILIDEVLEVLDIAAGAIEPPPSFGSAGVDTRFLLGVGKADKRVIFLLDIDLVLSAGEQEAVAAAA